MWRLLQSSRSQSNSIFKRCRPGLASLMGYTRTPVPETQPAGSSWRFCSSESGISQQSYTDDLQQAKERLTKDLSRNRYPRERNSTFMSFPRNKAQIKKSLEDLLETGEGSVEEILKSCAEDLLRESRSTRAELVDQVWADILKSDKLRPLGVSAYNALAAAYLRTDRQFDPKEFLMSMQENEVMPDPETLYSMLLRYCNQGDKEGAKTVLEHMQMADIPVTEKVYQALIKCHGKADDMAGAHSVFDALSEKGITLTESSYGALATVYADQGNFDGVTKILDKMADMRVFPSHAVYLDILKSLGPHPQHIPSLLQSIRNKKYMIADLNRLMVDFSAEGQFEASLHLMSVAIDYTRVFNKSLFERSVTLVTNHMMNSNASCDLVLQLAQKLGDLEGSVCKIPIENLMMYFYKQENTDLLLDHLRGMRQQGLPIRSHYLFPVLAKAVAAGDEAEAVKVLKAVQELELNSVDHNLISLFRPITNEKFMLKCFEEAGLMGDPHFVCELIQYFWVQRHPELLLKLIFSLPLSKEALDQLTASYSASISHSLKVVVTTLVDEGKADSAVLPILKLAEMKLLPPSANFTIAMVLKEQAKKGDRVEFNKFLGSLRELEYPLNDLALREVIRFTSNTGDLEKCMASFNQLKIRNETAYSELLRAFCLQKRVPQAEACYREMLSKGFKPTRNHLAQLVQVFLNIGDTQAAENYRKEMEGFGYGVHHILRQEFIRMYCMKGDFDKAKAELAELIPILQELNYNVVYPYVLLMKGYLSHGAIEGIREALEDMQSQQIAIEPAQVGFLLEGYLNSANKDKMLEVLRTSKERYGVPPSMVSILRLLNKLVASDDYETVLEVKGFLKSLHDQSDEGVAHNMLFAELMARHPDKALELGMSESFPADQARLSSFRKQIQLAQKTDMLEVLEKIVDFHSKGLDVQSE